MCLYHYFYYSSCQHGELSKITYCDRAKALDFEERDSSSPHSASAVTDPDNSVPALPSSPHPSTPSRGKTASLSHSHTQQPTHSMATMSPTKASASVEWTPSIRECDHHLSQHTAYVPRSVLPEADLPGSSHGTARSSTASQQAFHELNNERQMGVASMLPQGNFPKVQRPNTERQLVDTIFIENGHELDVETTRGLPEAEIHGLTGRNVGYSQSKSASPRRPLPAQWLALVNASSSAVESRPNVHTNTTNSSTGSLVERKTVRGLHGAFGTSKSHAEAESFLTKEALDAVNSNIASTTPRLSPSKTQRAPSKVPWNSPTPSPKHGSPRQSTGLARSSPTRTSHLATRSSAAHARTPSSIVSIAATSFYTAHGSPVGSPANSQTSFASSEEYLYNDHYQYSHIVANINVEQVESKNAAQDADTLETGPSLLTRPSRPDLSIRIPPVNCGIGAERGSAVTSGSAVGSSAASVSGSNTLPSPLHSSRIPRMSVSRGSTARAPTLSSTLKQTKSLQTLQLSRSTKRAPEAERTKSIKTPAEKSSRRVRTVNSSDSTPILETRESNDPEVSVSIAGVALSSTPRSAEIFESDVSSSHLQDLSVDSQVMKSCNAASPSTSQVTSTSTARAPRVFDDPASIDVAIIYSRKRSGDAGAFHPSNADDERDDSAISAPDSGNDLQNTLPIRRCSRQFEPNHRHATVGEATPQSTSASDLRATATEFVPGRNEGCSKVEDDAAAQAQMLPDMYALDGYGIPWFYHLYPIPYFYPSPPHHVRSRSPKKFRHKKQRWILNKSPERLQNESQGMEIQAEIAAFSSAQDTSIEQATTTKDAQDTTDTRDTEYVPIATPCLKPVEGPFSSQLDMVAHQASLQNHGSTVKTSHIDLTTIRNVPSCHEPTQLNLQDHATVPTRRRTNRRAGNGLYGGRGNAGIPLYATAPFPDPMPPLGGQTEHHSRDPRAYIGYAIATKSRGIIDVEKAAEHGGARACNTCEPDH